MEFYNDKFRSIREHRNISIKELTIALGRHRRTIWAWERGIQTPGLSDIKELARILHIPIYEISDIQMIADDSDDDFNIGKNLSSSLTIEDRAYLKGIEKELKALRESLGYAKSESLELQKIVNNLPTLIYRKDLQLKFVFANKAFLQTAGMEKYRALGSSNTNLFSGTYCNILNNLERRVVSGEKITNCEITIPGTKGKRKGYFYGNPIYDVNGKISGIAASIEDITDKSIAIERYRELEEAVNLSHDILWVKDKKKTNSFSFISQAIDRITGFKIKDIHNNAKFWINRVVHPDYKDRVIKYNKSKNWEKPIDYKIITADGKTKYMREKSYFENGLTFGIIEDRTEKMEYEKYQAMLLDIIHKVPYSVWISSNFGNKIDIVTDSFENFFNESKQSFKANPQKYLDLIHHKDVSKFKDWKESISKSNWWKCKSKKTLKSALRYRLLINKKILWVEEQIFSDLLLRKQGIRFGIIRNITEEIQNSTTLRLLKNVIDKVDDLVWVCTPPPNAKYLYISDAVEKIWGRSREEFIKDAKHWLNFIHPEDRKAEIEAIKKDEFPMFRTYRIIRPDGETRKLQSSSFRDVDENGTIVDFGVIRDITGR